MSQAGIQTIQVKGLCLGGGKTAVCAPLIGAELEVLRTEMAQVRDCAPDMVEWRADCFGGITDISVLQEALRLLRDGLPDVPILFTLRAGFENGAADIPRKAALAVYETAIASGCIDLLDTELANEPAFLRSIHVAAEATGIPVMLSHHNFTATPTEADMLETLCRAQEAGASIAKIAVMPSAPRDVLALLSALLRFRTECACVPAIGIAMGRLGAVTRAAGGLFGSAITYAALGDASVSAPGQLGVAEVRMLIDFLQP